MFNGSFFPFMFFPLFLLFGIIGFVIGIGSFVFWVMMLVDVIQRKFKDPNEKLIWILVIIFAHIVGALIYYFLVKRTHKK